MPLVAIFVALSLSAQDSPKHDSPDPATCKICKPALDSAVAFARSNFRNSNLAGHTFTGLMLLILGDKGQDLQACIEFAGRSIQTPTGGNSNWFIAMSAYFLSEVYLRDPSDKVRGMLVNAINTAGGTMEQTGGWGHSPGFWRSNNYHKKGGSRDLGIVTGMMYGAMLNMKAAGIGIPDAMFRRVEKHLESISDGSGFNYGTDNKVPDVCMSRASYVYLGLTNGQIDEHPFYAKIAEGLGQRFKKIEEGHACGALHHFGVAAAMHRAGKYADFSAYWIDRLIAKQKKDGSISLGCDAGDKFSDATSNAAVLAILLLLQKDGAFKAEGKKVEWKPAPAGGGANASPFSQKDKPPAPDKK